VAAAVYGILSMSFWVYVELTMDGPADRAPGAKVSEWSDFDRGAWGDMAPSLAPPLAASSLEPASPFSADNHRHLLSVDGAPPLETICA
jgi:hypothetical protein